MSRWSPVCSRGWDTEPIADRVLPLTMFRGDSSTTPAWSPYGRSQSHRACGHRQPEDRVAGRECEVHGDDPTRDYGVCWAVSSTTAGVMAQLRFPSRDVGVASIWSHTSWQSSGYASGASPRRTFRCRTVLVMVVRRPPGIWRGTSETQPAAAASYVTSLWDNTAPLEARHGVSGVRTTPRPAALRRRE